MLHCDPVRKTLLLLVALVFAAIAAYALCAPQSMAQGLGYTLQAPNGYSEFFAVYVGVWLATAALAVYAAAHLPQPLIGDIVALLVLAQPVGRCIAILGHGLPTGLLLYVFILEIVGGAALLTVRPTSR
jgi:hypothetical protein